MENKYFKNSLECHRWDKRGKKEKSNEMRQ